MIVIAADSYMFYSSKIKKTDKARLLIAATALLIICIASAFYNDKDKIWSYIITVVLLLLYLMLVLVRKKIKYKVWQTALVSLVVLELAINFIISFEISGSDIFSRDTAHKIESVVSKLDINGLERSVYNDSYIISNVGLIYGYNTCCGFSGNVSFAYSDELNKLGIGVNDQAVCERGFNSFLSSIFSRKYIFDTKRNSSNDGVTYISKNDAVFSNCEKEELNDITLYKNLESVNPIVVPENDIKVYSDYSLNNEANRDKVDDYNNKLCYSLTGIDSIMSSENADYKLEYSNNCEASIKADKLTITKNEELGDSDETVELVLSFVAPKDGEYSIYLFNNINLGYLRAGEKAYAYAGIAGYQFSESNEKSCDIVLNRLNHDKWLQAYSILKDNQIDVKEAKAGYIKGTISADANKQVFSTISYDRAWKVSVDGKNVPAKRVGNGFLSFDVDAGEHEICMQYKAGGVYLGIAITIVFIVISVLMLIYYRKGQESIWLEKDSVTDKTSEE